MLDLRGVWIFSGWWRQNLIGDPWSTTYPWTFFFGAELCCLTHSELHSLILFTTTFFHLMYSSEVNVMVCIVITFLIFQSFKPSACKEGKVQLWDNSQYRYIWSWICTYIPRWHEVLEYVCPVLVGSECVQTVTKKSIQVWFTDCLGFCVCIFFMLCLKMYTSFRKP